jgi:hypothetical protein
MFRRWKSLTLISYMQQDANTQDKSYSMYFPCPCFNLPEMVSAGDSAIRGAELMLRAALR